MGGGQDVALVDQSSTANVDGFLGVLLQNSCLPWIFAKLRIAIDVNWVLDSAVDSLRVSGSASAVFGLLTSKLTLLTTELALLIKLALLCTKLSLRSELLCAELLSLVSEWLRCT